MEHHASEAHALARKQTAVLHAGTCAGSLQVIPCNSLGKDTVSYSLSRDRSAILYRIKCSLGESMTNCVFSLIYKPQMAIMIHREVPLSAGRACTTLSVL